MRSRLLLPTTLAVALCAALGGCKRQQPQLSAAPSASVSTPDRLSPQEALPGREMVFGIEVPSGMRVGSKFNDVVYLSGSRSVRDLVTYFSKRVSVANVELETNGARFARAYVNGDTKKRVYRLEISRSGPVSHVVIRDVTEPPAIQGLSETERWQRAGLNPDGTLKDRLRQF